MDRGISSAARLQILRGGMVCRPCAPCGLNKPQKCDVTDVTSETIQKDSDLDLSRIVHFCHTSNQTTCKVYAQYTTRLERPRDLNEFFVAVGI